jgi:large subunit ribosomal protein L22
VPGVKTNEREGTRAVLRHSRMSAYKARQVLDQIRGLDADRAAETLALGDREAAEVIGKVLASAVANAVHNDGLEADELFVSACYADEGATLKRWRPRARGRATRIRKRTCHVTIIVSRLPDERIARRRAKQTVAGTQRSRRVAGSRRNRRSETAPVESKATATEVEETPIDEDELEPIEAEAVEVEDTEADAEDTEAGADAEEDTELADIETDAAGDEDVDTDTADETKASSDQEKGK